MLGFRPFDLEFLLDGDERGIAGLKEEGLPGFAFPFLDLGLAFREEGVEGFEVRRGVSFFSGEGFAFLLVLFAEGFPDGSRRV